MRNRFVDVFHVDLPGREERRRIWEVWLRKLGLEDRPYEDDEGWNGRNVSQCADKAWRMSVPVAEAAKWITATDAHNLDRVFLATPSSSDSRVGNASESSRGFVYAVSTMGITGAREDLDSQAKSVVSKVRKNSPESVTAVGIGISTEDQVRQVNSYADGAIVGSSFIAAYASSGLVGLTAKVRELAKGKS
jgi:tryptophan synthase alpha subunit